MEDSEHRLPFYAKASVRLHGKKRWMGEEMEKDSGTVAGPNFEETVQREECV